jgi:hypothetical protein
MNRTYIRSGTLITGVLIAGSWSNAALAQWTSLNNAALAGTGGVGPGTATLTTCELLTDATVICQEYNTNHWHRLAPDNTGSYVNGTWDGNTPGVPTIPDMPNGTDTSYGCTNCTYGPLYYAAEVLKDANMVVIGGEDNFAFTSTRGVDTNIGFIYNSATNTWGNQLTENFGGGNVGDTESVLLQDGTFLLPNINNKQMESLNEATGTFTVLTQSGKLDKFNEEGWTILPNNTILTVDAFIASSFEIFNPSGNTSVTSPAPGTWGLPPGITSSTMPVNIADTSNLGNSAEVGPAVLRPDGTVVYFSGNSLGQNAVYDWASGTWTHPSGIDFPLVSGQTYHISVKDGPASLLPDGNVLVQAAPVNNSQGTFLTGSQFFEVSLGTNALNSVTNPPNAANLASFNGRMLLLPTGEVLWTTDQGQVQIYQNGGTPQDAWRPTITSFNPHVAPGTTYSISGTLFNGFSQGAFYGDNAQSSTNYPLVRITVSASGHVFYARTHDHSRMGVEAVGDTETISTSFDAPAGLETTGPCTISVVANGIASTPVTVNCATNQPPVAKCQNVTVSADAVCLGSVTTAQVNNGSSDPDGDNLTLSLTPTSGLTLGSNTVTLTATDPSGASNSCTATVTVIDTTPPVLTLPTTPPVESCAGTGTVTVGQASATDNCAQNLMPQGEAIALNGVAVTPPIPIVNGQANLGIGTWTIQWTVSDGVNTVTENQTFVVGAAIEASQSFLVDDRGEVLNNGGGFAAVLNAGSGTTQIGNDAQSGLVLSVGPVDLLHRATVHGNVVSASTVTKDTDATVLGSITAKGTVVLPALPALPSFPPPNNGGFTVNSGTTRTAAPGSYSSVTVLNGGTLVLSAGDYFFQGLIINSASFLRVTPTTRIFVQNQLVYNAPIIGTTGTALQAIELGFNGANLGMFAGFNGTLIAPNATVDFGTGAGITYTGSFFARSIEVTPGSHLVCKVN